MTSSWGCMMGRPSVGQESGRKQDHQESRKDQWGGGWGPLSVLTKTIVLYFIPLTHWRILIRMVESFLKAGFIMSRPQSLSRPGPLCFSFFPPSYFSSPSTIQMQPLVQEGTKAPVFLLPPWAQPGTQNSMPWCHTYTFEPEFMQNPNQFQVMKSTLRITKAKAYGHP